jgi:S1-C subfamily serine protease
MTWTLATGEPARRPSGGPPAGGRRGSLGTVPDFAHPGPGVKVDRVMPDTPAQAAGVQPGDLLLAIDGEEIRDLRHYAAILRERSPGDRIEIRLTRGDRELELEATLAAR